MHHVPCVFYQGTLRLATTRLDIRQCLGTATALVRSRQAVKFKCFACVQVLMMHCVSIQQDNAQVRLHLFVFVQQHCRRKALHYAPESVQGN